MSEVAIPTCGRVVHYFPKGKDPDCSIDEGVKYAAIVHQADGLKADLSISVMNDARPVIIRLAVLHKSAAEAAETPGAYWDWPERS